MTQQFFRKIFLIDINFKIDMTRIRTPTRTTARAATFSKTVFGNRNAQG